MHTVSYQNVWTDDLSDYSYDGMTSYMYHMYTFAFHDVCLAVSPNSSALWKGWYTQERDLADSHHIQVSVHPQYTVKREHTEEYKGSYLFHEVQSFLRS
jgi:hypothetical protein